MIELKEDSIIFSINNNDVYDLPFLWFRDNCQCDECRITETQEKQFLLNTVPLSIKPVKALETEDSFLITWEDSHQTIIPFEVINNSLQSRYPKHQSWPKNFIPKKIDWDGFLNEKDMALDGLEEFVKHGVIILKNAPKEPETLEKLSIRLYPETLAPPSSAARYKASSKAVFLERRGELSSITERPVTSTNFTCP